MVKNRHFREKKVVKKWVKNGSKTRNCKNGQNPKGICKKCFWTHPAVMGAVFFLKKWAFWGQISRSEKHDFTSIRSGAFRKTRVFKKWHFFCEKKKFAYPVWWEFLKNAKTWNFYAEKTTFLKIRVAPYRWGWVFWGPRRTPPKNTSFGPPPSPVSSKDLGSSEKCQNVSKLATFRVFSRFRRSHHTGETKSQLRNFAFFLVWSQHYVDFFDHFFSLFQKWVDFASVSAGLSGFPDFVKNVKKWLFRTIYFPI